MVEQLVLNAGFHMAGVCGNLRVGELTSSGKSCTGEEKGEKVWV